jgi:hypothetical protein
MGEQQEENRPNTLYFHENFCSKDKLMILAVILTIYILCLNICYKKI